MASWNNNQTILRLPARRCRPRLIKGGGPAAGFFSGPAARRGMDAALRDAIERKMGEVAAAGGRMGELARRLGGDGGDAGAFARGAAAGRLYNSFHYQCRRLLKRDPTDEEFDEFVDMVRGRVAGLSPE